MVIKNSAQLKKILSEKCAAAVANVEKEIYDELANNLNQFYAEFNPEEYIRTGALLASLKHTGVQRAGNQHMSRATAEVYFDTPAYQHGFVPLQSGKMGYSYWTDEKILNVVMKSGLPHGGYEEGTAIWVDAMQRLGGRSGIKNLLKQELKKQGL